MRQYRQPVYDPNYRRTPLLVWVVLIVAVMVAGFVIYAIVRAGNSGGDAANSYRVTRVMDGDTLDVLVKGESRRVRLIGIDTPEIGYSGEPDECYAQEAKIHLSGMVMGEDVHLESDASQDAKDVYDRYLYYIKLDGKNINQVMVSDGYAREYTYDVAYRYQEEFKTAQVDAERRQVGLWSDDACAEPEADEENNVVIPAQTSVDSGEQSASCDPNYSPCVPNVSYDLDCADISGSVRVVGIDRHRFDRDGDGYGCEAN